MRKGCPNHADQAFSAKTHQDADAAEQAEKRRQRDKLLRDSGLDPNPPRSHGQIDQRKTILAAEIENFTLGKNRAIQEERFEEAARLRERITEIRKELIDPE